MCLGEIILNSNNKTFFLLYHYFYLFCNKVFFYSDYIITHLLTISALTDIRSLHCTFFFQNFSFGD